MRDSVEEKILLLLRKIANKEVKKLDAEQDIADAPPMCGMLLHQPQRPQRYIGSMTQLNKFRQNSKY